MSDKSQTKNPGSDKPNAVVSFIKKYPVQVVLSLLLVIVLFWSNINGKRIARELNAAHHKEIVNIKEQFGLHLGTSFALAIRSELTRANEENAKQYMVELLRNAEVNKVQFVDRSSATITISTDRNDEDKKIDDDFILSASKVVTELKDDSQRVVAPIMGVSDQLGWIVIFMNW